MRIQIVYSQADLVNKSAACSKNQSNRAVLLIRLALFRSRKTEAHILVADYLNRENKLKNPAI